MQWIQRNSFYVLWGGVALVLSALAFIFWYGGYRHNSELDRQLEAERTQLEELLSADPQPSPENVKAVLDDTARVEKEVAEALKLFPSVEPARLDAGAFRKLLDDSIFDLNARAVAASVAVPSNFNFAFSSQRVAVSFSPGSIARLAARLEDIQSLCQILYDARVYSIESLRRSAASAEEALTSPDLLVALPTTNAATGFVRYPYELSFTGFTRELARVLEGLNRSPNFLVVRNVGVAAAPPPPAPVTPQAAAARFANPGVRFPFPRPVPNPDDDPDMEEEPDMEEDPDMEGQPPTGPAARPRYVISPATSDTVLDEQLLQFTLRIDLIRAPAGATP